MTTIVFDGATVAADRLVGGGGMLYKRPAVKLVWSEDRQRLYAHVGRMANFAAWIEWYIAGHDPLKLPAASEDDCFLVFQRTLKDEQHKAYTPKTPYGEIIDEPDAWGSGGDYAIGALDAGLNAYAACVVACGRDKSSGNGVMVADLATGE